MRKLFWDKLAVCVCLCMVTQLQAELGILNYHISTSRDKPKGFTQMSVRKHTCMHTHSTPTYLWNCRPPAEKLKHTSWGWGELWRWSGGGRGGEGCWLWRSMRLVSDIETKVKHKPSVLFCYRPISGWQQRRVTKSRFRVRFWETCDGGAARGSDGILDLTFAALPCIVFQLCLSLAI